MKFIAISDTHSRHHDLVLPKGDVLIHAGDVSRIGDRGEILDFLQWFEQQDFAYKIFIAGNHDFYFEKMPPEIIKNSIPPGVIYLNDSSVTIEGVKIWGSPITPWFFDWAFNRQRGADIRKHWDLIPDDVDILITHGPVYNMLDKTVSRQHAGCADLLQKVMEIKPKYHICGHIHEAYGMARQAGIQFINASVLNEHYRLVNEPIIFEW
ncbi:MAG: metallophosphatase domain-containing protein [Saprospiraceae bacterium]